ncbi:MFS transporter [Virgibacillus soli]|uniref:MFS transporter n=1 Tax=Paracerasibacillus soli TaxID=480284 RepID=A0ABU5CPV6_9BACI|nr:MFS transporter [Virgibacillus soli]MDY0407500.1 MFS transporter [Virgibacillus soli]
MKQNWKSWRKPTILLCTLGFAGIGDFIYLVAINILVYQITESAAAVATLWMIGPLVNIATKFWTGSYIDYRNKRKIMMITYFIRGVLILCIPFAPNMYVMFLILICLSIAKSFFSPASITYIAAFIHKGMRKRFNSIQSLTSSGAFIIGPSIAGSLILLFGVHHTLFINSGAFFIAALLLSFLPHVDDGKQKAPRLSFAQIKGDWVVGLLFMKQNKYVALIYGLFLTTTIFSFAMDAQEVVFTQQVIGLSEMDYSLLISITGIGSVIGAFLLSTFSNTLSLRYMIGIGVIMQTIGYLIYAFSWSFLSIVVGFILLGFFLVFLNAGMMTFYQNNVPTEIMGRVTSMFQLAQSGLQIIFVITVGGIADIIPLRITIIFLASCMLIVSIFILLQVLQNDKSLYYQA